MAHAKAGAFLPAQRAGSSVDLERISRQVPQRYVRTEVADAEEVAAGCAIPIIDLSRLLDPRSWNEELRNLGSACQHWGFFQLINHGVPDEVIQDVKRDITEFFKLPLEAKKAYAQLPGGIEGCDQAFVLFDAQKLDWADMIYLMVSPTHYKEQNSE
ncbi:2-oxoglutarate-dependent dioxygenase 11-like [Phragmites australis]|uniref:2-oxoglutarate-dependent dioxygenase 11-like n=1 Tax=Phragmites australis TaxID=29695 RepID=UPI002D799417|nr:2-oxoglutarate-dependent dioxygenase 11-like [Phragmites australis]